MSGYGNTTTKMDLTKTLPLSNSKTSSVQMLDAAPQLRRFDKLVVGDCFAWDEAVYIVIESGRKKAFVCVSSPLPSYPHPFALVKMDCLPSDKVKMFRCEIVLQAMFV